MRIIMLSASKLSYPVWEWTGGKAVLVGEYPSPEAQMDAFRSAQKQDRNVAMRPGGESQDDVTKMFRDREAHEAISAERRGGPGSLVTKDYGFVIARPPKIVLLANDQWGANERDDEEVDEFWKGFGTTSISPEEPLCTEQEFVSGTAVGEKDPSGEPQAFIVEDRRRRKWVLDGHHYIVAARRRKLPFLAYVIDYQSAKDALDEIYADG